MSIAGYLGRPERLTTGEQLRKALLEQRPAGTAELYKRVEDYDPVLRDHCRFRI